ncbi:hypothetical protein JCM5296_004089 [Sporobolomyces johnsonii]
MPVPRALETHSWLVFAPRTAPRNVEQGQVGFLSELRRLNVSMTRPRRHLVVVGDSSTVRKGSAFLEAWIEWLEDEALVRVPS